MPPRTVTCRLPQYRQIGEHSGTLALKAVGPRVVSGSVSLDPPAELGVHDEPHDPPVPAEQLHDGEITMAVMLPNAAHPDPGPESDARPLGACARNVMASSVSVASGPVRPPNTLDVPVGAKEHPFWPYLRSVPRSVFRAQVNTGEPRGVRRAERGGARRRRGRGSLDGRRLDRVDGSGASGNHAGSCRHQRGRDHDTANCDEQARHHVPASLSRNRASGPIISASVRMPKLR